MCLFISDTQKVFHWPLVDGESQRGHSSWMALNKTVLEGNGRQKRIPRTPMGASSSAALKSWHIWGAAISKSREKKWNEVKGKSGEGGRESGSTLSLQNEDHKR